MGSLEVVRKHGQAYIRKQFFLHLLLILLDGKATLYSVFYHSAITKKCKAQISFMSMMFQEDSRSKRRKKNKLFLIYLLCFVGVFFRAIVQSGKGLGASAVLSPPGQNHWKMPHGISTLGWPKAPGAGGLSKVIGSLPRQCLCPAAWPEGG